MTTSDEHHDDTGAGVDCGELFGKLDLYLDRELSQPELARLERHFSECLPCTGRRDFEEQLRAVVRERCADQAPAETYAKLLDQGTYLCSIRTMYRILEDNHEVRERRNQLRHPAYATPRLVATAPNQVWTWDITKLLGPAKWTSYYL